MDGCMISIEVGVAGGRWRLGTEWRFGGIVGVE